MIERADLGRCCVDSVEVKIVSEVEVGRFEIPARGNLTPFQQRGMQGLRLVTQPIVHTTLF